ncbi:4-oxalocrotonate tautomerase [Acidovorax sp. 93]|uniref:tautomerase family protein n=1 Tax=Acidovorax sp. 93 TaxID=2135632 RepID=UPI000EB5F328|nr:4-oxalocrotonate tautomerase family protein [Acidovorax sp. 93]RKR27515.1 4-oxalocrotonate tautomerase [Acidovorax sp. 93]
MPLVNIRLARRDLPTTAAQKAALIAGVTQLMQQVLDKRPESVTVIIDEVDPENWGEGGEPVTVIRKRRKGPTQLVV